MLYLAKTLRKYLFLALYEIIKIHLTLLISAHCMNYKFEMQFLSACVILK